MRFAEHSFRLTCIVTSALLSACAMFAEKPEQSPSATPAPAVAAGAKIVAPPAAIARPEPGPISPAVQRDFDAARQALAAGRTAEAERGFAALTKSNPELAGPYANLGLIYRQVGKNTEAIAAFEKAVQLSPQRADLNNQLGISYRMAGDFTKAKASYERAISVDPTYAPAVLNLGILYDLYLWDGAHALELYDRYLLLAPGGDDQVKRWTSDLKNRSSQKNAAQRKEQG